MKESLKVGAIAVLILLPVIGFGQEQQFVYKTQIVAPLDTLLERAYLNSPRINSYQKWFEESEVDMRLARKQFLKYFTVAGQYMYGTAGFLLTENNGFLETSSLSNQRFSNYQVAAGFKIPMSAFINRNADIKKVKLRTERLYYEKEQQKEELREKVEFFYGEFRDAIVQVESQSKLVEAIRPRVTDAKEKYERGIIGIADYSINLEALIKAEGYLERYRVAVENAYVSLRHSVGESIFIY